ncbi:MAG: DUF4339 domain-containing protein [Parachlamydiales bacterium]|nr:DUF4339 domain-containing protein [Parachlamydiales bacterium]
MILLMISWICFGLFCSNIAKSKNRSRLTWFFLGVFFGLVALLIIIFLKPLPLLEDEIIIQQARPNEPIFDTTKDFNFWYYLDNDKTQVGPISFDALYRKYLSKIISESTYVWNDTMKNWQKIKEISIFSKNSKASDITS